MAELKTSIAVCRSFIDECIAQHNIGQLGNDTASMAKVFLANFCKCYNTVILVD